jgi:hypothetical protein
VITIRDLVSAVVTKHAEDELPLVEMLESLDDQEIVRGLRQRERNRERLGFGFGEIVGEVTPVLWLVLAGVAQYTGEQATDGFVGRLRRLFRRRRNRGETPERLVLNELSGEELGSLRERVKQAGLEQGLSEGRAKAIADAVVAELAVSAQRGEPSS